jgi:DNA-binding IclR family transcriptional regulator
MVELSRQVQESVHLAILSDTETLYIDKVDSPRSLAVMSKVGQRSPLHCTALGKVLLAFQNPEEQARIIKRIELRPFTARTITSKEGLKKELQWVRLKGYALDRRESEDEVECIAAPIRDHLGNAVAAISISGPQRKINTPQEKIFVQKVIEAAKSISAKLGFIQK